MQTSPREPDRAFGLFLIALGVLCAFLFLILGAVVLAGGSLRNDIDSGAFNLVGTLAVVFLAAGIWLGRRSLRADAVPLQPRLFLFTTVLCGLLFVVGVLESRPSITGVTLPLVMVMLNLLAYRSARRAEPV